MRMHHHQQQRHSPPCHSKLRNQAGSAPRAGLYLLLSGVGALLWLLVRSGTRPSRLTYPCQQAALSTATAVFGVPFVAALLGLRLRVFNILRTTAGKALVAVVGAAGAGVVALAVVPGRDTVELRVSPDDYSPAIYLVNDSRGPSADRHGGIDDLVELMGRNGFKWHRSAASGISSGPQGMIGHEDFVLIKINGQWAERGGTNTDVLRGVLRQIVEHPAGFAGEILVVDNGQGRGNLNPAGANAEDTRQSTRDVVEEFRGEGWTISSMLWDGVRYASIREFSASDMRNGYVVNTTVDPETRIRVSYPKFRTSFGTYVSYRHGIWSEESQSFDPEKLVVINLPVFKTHSIYGITASVKNHMGVVTRELGTDSHNAIGRGGLGSFLAEVRMPDLNILDCTWILARPGSGPSAPYSQATRRDQLVASTDPVALDAWATKFIMIPQIIANGYSASQYRGGQDPDYAGSQFRRYLDRTLNELLAAEIPSTNDYAAATVYTWPDARAFFTRGDANLDDRFDVSDAVTVLGYKFLGWPLTCEDSADVNDDGQIDISDALYVLEHLFARGPEPPPPFAEPGPDPTEDQLECGEL